MENNNQKQPYVIAVIGANGCGKSETMKGFEEEGFRSLGRTFPIPTLWLNPDAIANELKDRVSDQGERDSIAFERARELRQVAMQNGDTFAFESVASHTSRTAELRQLKARGYCIVLVFIGTSDPLINVQRVHFRYATGSTTGHFVEEHKVRNRYHLLNRLMPLLAEVADVAFFLDNSGIAPDLQVVIDPDSFHVTENPALWLQTHLLDRLEARFHQRVEIAEDLGIEVSDINEPDVGEGNYQGQVVKVTKDFIVVEDENLLRLVIHDRLMLETDKEHQRFNCEAGDYITISYNYRHCPRTEVRQP